MDALLDLWIHAVYNDPSVQGSDAGPVVYFRNQTGNPLFSYQELARRWKQSKSSVSRLLKKLERYRHDHTDFLFRETWQHGISA